MSLEADEDEHSIEMQLPYLAKVKRQTDKQTDIQIDRHSYGRQTDRQNEGQSGIYINRMK